MIKLLWAMTADGVIGKNGLLPWKIKSEMQYFTELTTNNTVLMGSKTFESIGKPLKNRYNIIVSNHLENYQKWKSFPNIIITNDLYSELKKYVDAPTTDLWVIGGAQIFNQSWDLADYLYVSIIHYPYKGDLKFPILDFSNFDLISQKKYEDFTAMVYKRKGIN